MCVCVCVCIYIYIYIYIYTHSQSLEYIKRILLFNELRVQEYFTKFCMFFF